jgi:hypothetical protein
VTQKKESVAEALALLAFVVFGGRLLNTLLPCFLVAFLVVLLPCLGGESAYYRVTLGHRGCDVLEGKK